MCTALESEQEKKVFLTEKLSTIKQINEGSYNIKIIQVVILPRFTVASQ